MAKKKYTPSKVRPGGSGLGRQGPGGVTPPAQAGQMMMDYLRQQQAKGAAPAPAPPPAPTPAPQPDAAYHQRLWHAEREQERQIGDVGKQRREIKFEFGIDDLTNPFGRAQAQKKMYLNQGRAVTTGMSSRGQQYSGAHGRAAAGVRHRQEKDAAALKSEYNKLLADLASRETEIKGATEAEKIAAFESWLARAGGG